MTSHSVDLDAYIEGKLANGQFRSRNEFFLEAARVYRELEQRQELLRHELERGLAEADQGLVLPLDIEAMKRELIESIDEAGQPRRH